jgi:hypothetical protein
MNESVDNCPKVASCHSTKRRDVVSPASAFFPVANSHAAEAPLQTHYFPPRERHLRVSLCS